MDDFPWLLRAALHALRTLPKAEPLPTVVRDWLRSNGLIDDHARLTPHGRVELERWRSPPRPEPDATYICPVCAEPMEPYLIEDVPFTVRAGLRCPRCAPPPSDAPGSTR